jgi:hypothetical protein
MRYFDDNVIFFRIHSIHPPDPLRQRFLFPSPHQLVKAQCKYHTSAGLVVDADAVAMCVPDIRHDCKTYPSLQKLLPPFLAADFRATDVNIFEVTKPTDNFEKRSQSGQIFAQRYFTVNTLLGSPLQKKEANLVADATSVSRTQWSWSDAQSNIRLIIFGCAPIESAA